MNSGVQRKIIWLSSLDKKYTSQINELEKKLEAFYASNPDYYSNIDFTSGNWNSENEDGYADILRSVAGKSRILEVGCGSANILKNRPDLEATYWGCDFSNDLIKKNSEKYNGARFTCLDKPNVLPYEDLQFDVVFSVFVIEHSANPALFLTECTRVLKEKGILIILCPDFLGRGRMSSQRSGLSRGTTRDKLKDNKFWDALITFYDNKIKIPLYCLYLSKKIKQCPKFYINVNPTVFTDQFIPDVDAVYLTYKKEMSVYLQKMMDVEINITNISHYEKSKKLIYLKSVKKRFKDQDR